MGRRTIYAGFSDREIVCPFSVIGAQDVVIRIIMEVEPYMWIDRT